MDIDLKSSVAEVVAQQAKVGVDIVSDGEFGKFRTWSAYVLERLVGLSSYFDAARIEEVNACLDAGARPEAISFGNTPQRCSCKTAPRIRYEVERVSVPGALRSCRTGRLRRPSACLRCPACRASCPRHWR